MEKGYELAHEEYAQSANTLFHFMTKAQYLKDILLNKAIVPRYCKENLKYLEISNEEVPFVEALVLQKCFCDIPFHKLTGAVHLQAVGDQYQEINENRNKNFLRIIHPLFFLENIRLHFQKMG